MISVCQGNWSDGAVGWFQAKHWRPSGRDEFQSDSKGQERWAELDKLFQVH